MQEAVYRIAIIDDHRLFVAGLELILKRLAETVVLDCFLAPDDCLAAGHDYDLIVLDFYIPGHSALDTIAAIRARDESVPIVLLSSSVSPVDRSSALSAGATEFVQKHAEPDQLLETLRRVLSRSEAGTENGGGFETPEIPGLTPRQVEIMLLVGKGFSNKEIARLLSISPETVKSHLKEVFLRFGLRNRVEAIDFTRQNGLG